MIVELLDSSVLPENRLVVDGWGEEFFVRPEIEDFGEGDSRDVDEGRILGLQEPKHCDSLLILPKVPADKLESKEELLLLPLLTLAGEVVDVQGVSA